MTEHDVLVGFRLRLFALAEKLGNVSAACRAMAAARRFARGFIFSGGPACNEDRCRFRGWDCLSYGRGSRIDTRRTTGSKVVRWQWVPDRAQIGV